MTTRSHRLPFLRKQQTCLVGSRLSSGSTHGTLWAQGFTQLVPKRKEPEFCLKLLGSDSQHPIPTLGSKSGYGTLGVRH